MKFGNEELEISFFLRRLEGRRILLHAIEKVYGVLAEDIIGACKQLRCFISQGVDISKVDIHLSVKQISSQPHRS